MTQKGRMQMDKVAEKLRFNALTQEQAKAHADKFEGQKFDLRSCWSIRRGLCHTTGKREKQSTNS